MLKLKAKILGLEAGGKSVVVLNKEDAEDLSVTSLERVRITKDDRESIAIVNTTTKLIERGTIGVYEEVRNALNLEGEEEVEVEIAPVPSSVHFIRNKLRQRKLTYEEIREIVRDMVRGNLSAVSYTHLTLPTN